MNPETAVYDHVIVGAGTAGCLLANRLSADPACRVLLVEAGGRDDYHWIHIPVGYLYCIGNPRTDWLYKTEADAGLNGRSLIYPRGKVLGGCAARRATTTTGPKSWATRPGAGTPACPISNATKTTGAVPTPGMARVPNGVSSASG